MLAERQATTFADRIQVVTIWGILVMACSMFMCHGSALPPLDSAFSLPTEKFRSLKNCTDKHCQMIYQLNFDEIRRIALIRLAVLKKIHSRLHPKETPTTVPLPSGEPTSPPETSTTPSPPWLFDDIVTFAEKPDLVNPPDYNVVKFKVGNQKAKSRLEAKRADLWI
ncbi:uncharacterized protein LOC135477692 [Liolophura sinensis]|uniref:uncharacterized protein LOC135477692 n=1 Tax=Liolophura sinensis TaxID=3198878 RepID=UPI00315900FF